MSGEIYRAKSRLLHRFNLHHTRRSPMPDGTYMHRCEWCGLSRREVPMSVTAQRMRDERARAAPGCVCAAALVPGHQHEPSCRYHAGVDDER